MTSMISDHGEHSKNVRLISKTMVGEVGAGQIIVDNGIAYVAHNNKDGVTLVDVTDPSNPKVLSTIPPPANTHTHKVQVCGDLMIVNNERYLSHDTVHWRETKLTENSTLQWSAGVRVYDVADKTSPREIGFWKTEGIGVHRMWFVDGRYAHVTASMAGFTHEIYVILDLKDPKHPEVVSHWWLPGMWEAGGELPDWPLDYTVRAHGPAYVHEDRTYLGWTDGGLTILDISDLTKPSLISRFTVTPPFGGLCHTVMPLPKRGLMVVSHEAHMENCQEPEKHLWIYDIRNEKNPIPIAVASVESEGFCQKGGRFGPHNIHENRPGSKIDDQYIYATYFNGGLRIIDIRDRYRPVEAGYFIPERPSTWQKAVQTNDVFVDADGLIYIMDRIVGQMCILEFTPEA